MYELELKIAKMYLLAKNELSRSRPSKVRALQTDTLTERRDQTYSIRTAAFECGNKEIHVTEILRNIHENR